MFTNTAPARSAAEKVFPVPELAELILLNLEWHQLFCAQAVSSTFAEHIESSIQLRRKMFLAKPNTTNSYDDPALKPLNPIFGDLSGCQGQMDIRDFIMHCERRTKGNGTRSESFDFSVKRMPLSATQSTTLADGKQPVGTKDGVERAEYASTNTSAMCGSWRSILLGPNLRNFYGCVYVSGDNYHWVPERESQDDTTVGEFVDKIRAELELTGWCPA